MGIKRQRSLQCLDAFPRDIIFLQIKRKQAGVAARRKREKRGCVRKGGSMNDDTAVK